ncbi:MAG: DUF5011 domain-containing protein, partial [Woeseia sp.]|nr:DUF5011 domain-containing protein [Woeseia sp.]
AAIDAVGNVYIADSSNNRIRRVATNGTITTFAGLGTAGLSGDGGDATQAEFNEPVSIDLDAVGNLYIVDQGNKRVRRIDAINNVITTVAGNWDGVTGQNYNGDNQLATEASLKNPQSVSVTDAGVIYIVDQGSQTLANNGPRVRMVDLAGMISTVAGNGASVNSGNGGLAISASLSGPFGVYVDSNDDLYIADSGNHAIRRVLSSTGIISIFAGNRDGTAGGVATAGELATDTSLRSPRGVSGDAQGNIYIADYNNDQAHKVDVDDRIITVVGTGARGFNGDGRDPLRATLAGPHDVVVDANGDPLIVDFLNDRVRRIGLASINRPVTDIFLSNNSISTADGAGTTIGMLTGEDASPGNTHLYSLVPGVGDTDNALFQISGSGSNAELQVGSGGVIVAGTYAIRIESNDQQDSTFHQTFMITVVSSNAVPPVITLVGANPQVVVVGDAYVELGATASDDIDGDITGSIVTDLSALDTAVIADYTVTYNVMDSAGNAATEMTRTVSVVALDTEAPVITLSGANPQVTTTGSFYTELGATAMDNFDGDISGSIVIDSSGVNTAVAGSYSVTYNVMDAAGNAAVEAVRTVTIQNPPPPPASSGGGGSFGIFGLLFLIGAVVRRRIFVR